MNRLLPTLGKLLGVLLVTVGFLVGMVGLSCTIGLAVEWNQLGRLTENARNAGLACTGLAVAGVLVLWAGAVLLRKSGAKYEPMAPRPPARSTPQEAEAVLTALAWREQPATASAAVTLALLVCSLAAFVAGGRLHWSRSGVAVIAGALFFHECGHYVAMRAFGYRNLRMFFIPFLGAAVAGSNPRAVGWQKALVALAGPLPGILVGAGLLRSIPYLGHSAPLCREVAVVLLSLNAFNLLPLLPLDGGRFLYETLFCRHALLRTGFVALTGAALLAFAIRSGFRPLQVLGAMVLAGAVATVRQDRAVRRLRSAGVQLLAPSPAPGEEEPVRPEALPPLLDALKADRQRRSRRALVMEALAVIDLLRARPPGRAAALNLLALYGATVALALALLLPILPQRPWHFPHGRVEMTRPRPGQPAAHQQPLISSAAD